MRVEIKDYASRSREIIKEDPGVREAVTGATIAFDEMRRQGYAEVDADAWRRWAEGVKNHTLTHLDHYLTEAEARLEANGAEVHWASDAAEAREIVTRLAKEHSVKSVVKGKSMATEEIDLNPALEDAGDRGLRNGPWRIHPAAPGGTAQPHPGARHTQVTAAGAAALRRPARLGAGRGSRHPRAGRSPRVARRLHPCGHGHHGRQFPRRGDGNGGPHRERGEHPLDDFAALVCMSPSWGSRSCFRG